MRYPKHLAFEYSSKSADIQQKTDRRKNCCKKQIKKKAKPLMDLDTYSSSEEGDYIQFAKSRHIVKPPKYDFEIFLAQFRNCSAFNKWMKIEQLAYL